MPAIGPTALAILTSTPAVLRVMLVPLPDAAPLAPLDEGWRVRDAVAHILGVEEFTVHSSRQSASSLRLPFLRGEGAGG